MQHCIHCSSNSSAKDTTILSFEQIKDLIKQLKSLSYIDKDCHISISGGEPFLHPDIFKILNLLQSENIKFSIYTCGNINGNPISEQQIKQVIDNKMFDKIIFSCHGVGNDYNYISQTKNGWDIFQQSIKNVEKYTNIELHFVPLVVNLIGFSEVINFALSHNVNRISILKAVAQGRCTEDLLPTNTDLIQFINSIDKKKINIRLGNPLRYMLGLNNCCTAGREKFVVTSDGYIVPCEVCKQYRTEWGNIHKQTLNECLTMKKFNLNSKLCK
jgi:MoaA/NifB/PqqE/SkfB family radical SAM enzyme